MFTKLKNNLGFEALSLLGLKVYMTMLFRLVANFIPILRSRSFGPLDQAMTHSNLWINHWFGRFRLNVNHIDSLVQDNTYTFGAVRELYIRNCYFYGHPHLKTAEIKNVIDLGANRGLFSTMCTPFSKKILLVEAQTQYNEAIDFNLRIANQFFNYQIINRFIGQDGKINAENHTHISFDELLKIGQMDVIDFIKIDIEGSEFSLFQENLPLERIHYISMEIHPQYGNVNNIISQLEQYNFDVLTTTENFKHTSDPSEISFLYAKNLAFNY